MIPAKDLFLTAIERQPTLFYFKNLEKNDNNDRNDEITLREETNINPNQLHSSDQEAFEGKITLFCLF